MAIDADILIDYTNKRIYQDHAYDHTVDTAYNTQALYSYLMDKFDEQEHMDDQVPMSAQTPNAFTMINGWFIDDETVKWFKNGAITTAGWTHPTNTTGIRTLTLDAAAGLTIDDIGKEVLGGTTGDTGKLLAYNVTRKVLWVRCDDASDLFDDAAEAITVDGQACGNTTAVSATGENLYVNLYTLGTLTSGSDTIYIIQDGTKITDWWATGITGCDVLIKVKEMDVVIDGGDVTVFCRYYPVGGNAALFDHFPITLSGGRQAVPLSTGLDLNNTDSQDTVERYVNGASYTITFGFAGTYSRDLNNGNGFKNYDVEIDCNTASLAITYEACKYVTREDSAIQLDSMDGEQYISADAGYTPVKQSPFGTFAGGKFFGAQGVWIKNYAAADVKNFQLIASDGSTQVPPNIVACAVTSVVSGDAVAMFMLDGSGGNIEKDTYSLDGAHLSNATSVVVEENIAGNWAAQSPPQAGYLRVVDAGVETLAQYASWTAKTFTLDGTLGSNCAGTSTVYVPIIDDNATGISISNTLIQTATVYVRTRVRKYAAGANNSIIPFEIDGTISATGLSVPAIRTTDGIST
jgi:hypothetical protein